MAEICALFARCFQRPDDETVEAIRTGRLGEEIYDRATALGVDVETPPEPPKEEVRETYRRAFEAFDGPYAPPVESVYREWWDGKVRGLLSGPPASDMRSRYDALDAEIPPGYPADHLALLLEYANLLLEAEREDAYVEFHDAHLEWIPDFRRRVEETVETPFYRWVARTLERTLERTRKGVETDE